MLAQKLSPPVPGDLMKIEEGRPVVFYFKQQKPEAAVLPVYVTLDDETEQTALSKNDKGIVTPPSATIQTERTQTVTDVPNASSHSSSRSSRKSSSDQEALPAVPNEPAALQEGQKEETAESSKFKVQNVDDASDETSNSGTVFSAV